MRKIFLLLFIVFLLPQFAQAQQKFRIGIDAPYPPFAYTDPISGKLTGFDHDIAVALCTEMQVTCEIIAVPFDEIIPQIVAGKLDIGVAGMAKTPERAEKVLFTDKYFRSSSVFIEIPGTNTVSRKGLEGKKIAVQADTTQENYLRKNYPKSVIVPIKHFDDIIIAVRNKDVDIAFIDGLPSYHFLKSDAGLDFDLAGEPVKIGSGSCAVVSKKLPKVRDAMNKAILEIRKKGIYDKINRDYFEFNVY